jgi:hypothetical protein
MDGTLALNFCPFRSPSWDTLQRRDESVRFSAALWAEILSLVRPKAIVCLGDLAATHIGSAMTQRGGRARASAEHATGWGTVTFATTTYNLDGDEILLLRLPHLSRFGFFGRPASAVAPDAVARTVAAAIDH